MLRYKAFRGNLMMKFDVRKFDTIDWCFLTHILEAFGFYPIFCKCIRAILESAKLYFSVNGKAVGGGGSFKRGVKAGRPSFSSFVLYSRGCS